MSEQLIAKIDTSLWRRKTFSASPDSKRVAYVVEMGANLAVTVNDRLGER